MILLAIKKTLDNRRRKAIFFFSSLLIFALLIFIPVWTTPGNDFVFQLMLLRWYGLVLVIFLSFSSGLLLAMQWYIREESKRQRSLSQKAVETSTAVGLVVGALASTIACAACYSSLLSLLGLGAVAFLVSYQLWIILATVAITLFALYNSARRVNNECQECRITK